MKKIDRTPFPALTAVAAALAVSATAQAATPVGDPVLVTSQPVNEYDYAQSSGGGFVAAWIDPLRTTLNFRRFAADGTALDAAPITVAVRSGTGLLSNPHVAINAAGDTLVSWEEYVQTQRSVTSPFPNNPGLLVFNDRQAGAVRVRGYRADGSPRGDALTLIDYPNRNDFLTDFQSDVAIDADGDFSLTWVDGHAAPQIGTYGPIIFPVEQTLLARRFHADGRPIGLTAVLGVSALLAQATGTIIFSPSIASDAAGNTTVAWGQGLLGGAFGTTIFRRTLGANGLLGGPTLPVAIDLGSLPDNAHTSIAMTANGRFTIAWDGCVAGVCARNFLPGGLAAGLQYPVSDDVAAAIRPSTLPHVALDASGRAVFGFGRLGTNGREGFVRTFDASGAPGGPSTSLGLISNADVQVGSESGGNFTAVHSFSTPIDPGTSLFQLVSQRYVRP